MISASLKMFLFETLLAAACMFGVLVIVWSLIA
jgi:hypothetical protein